MACWKRTRPDGLNVALYGNRPTLREPGGQALAKHLATHLVHRANVICVVPPGDRNIVDTSTRITENGYFVGDAIVMPCTPGTGFAIQSRDCPIAVLYDPRAKLIAGAHAGKHELSPTSPDIIARVMEKMTAQGAHPSCVHAYIMGSISSTHFAHDRCPHEVLPFLEHYGNAVCRDRTSYGLDLPTVIRHILNRLGVPAHQITHDGLCTYKAEWLGSKRAADAGVPNKNNPNIVLALMQHET